MTRFPALATALALIATGVAPTASAEVLIAPTRVELDRAERSTELVVVNKGNEEAAFRVSIENRRMRLDGSMEAAETALADELFAKDFIRFSPRRIILEPGERQTIRVSAMLNSELEQGEYRSHLRLMAAPLSAGRTLESATESDGDALSIQLVAIRSITIPVIFRLGDLSAEVEIEDMDLRVSDNEGETVLVARLSRTGTRSTYGDLKIFVEGQPEPVYFARGIALYTPNTERDVMLPLPDAVRDRLAGKDIRIDYVSSDPSAPGTIASLATRL
ncbi:MAG: molecular chaperone [Pseudomonadota bacterium]